MPARVHTPLSLSLSLSVCACVCALLCAVYVVRRASCVAACRAYRIIPPQLSVSSACEIAAAAEVEAGVALATLQQSSASTSTSITHTNATDGSHATHATGTGASTSALPVSARAPPQHITRGDALGASVCRSDVPEAAMCGIERVWVHRGARRQGVATKLLDYIRSSFVFAYRMEAHDVAFSQPVNHTMSIKMAPNIWIRDVFCYRIPAP